jgi:Phytanoyl-CoA dioxygenase (PhyH)
VERLNNLSSIASRLSFDRQAGQAACTVVAGTVLLTVPLDVARRRVCDVTQGRTLQEVLAQEGIADLTGLWLSEQVEAWNRRVDPLFAAISDQPRSYVSADQLVETGILQEALSGPVRRVIASIQPSALLYHCHCYEIAAGQTKPHIQRNRFQGWHRDWETLRDFTKDFPTFVSIFVLMSPVGDADGPFEFVPKSPETGLQPTGEIVRLVGPVGTAAIWNRAYYHRAAPNRGPRRRRILKFSFQPAGLPNGRIRLDEFKAACSKLDDPGLRAFVDARRVGTTDPLPEAGDPVEGRSLPATARNELTGVSTGFERLYAAGCKLVNSALAGR